MNELQICLSMFVFCGKVYDVCKRCASVISRTFGVLVHNWITLEEEVIKYVC